MTDTGITGLILVIINFLVSYKGFKDPVFFERYKFYVDGVVIRKEYYRLLTSGFLHLGWMHLIFNMLSLYVFSGMIEFGLGSLSFLLIYFISLAGGNLLSFFVHRNHGDYGSAGASGAVCGVIFASIALFPGMGIGFFGIPLSIPAWLYGLLYVLYSMYGIRSKQDHTGHEAHLGGALLGMGVALLLKPETFFNNSFAILVITVPSLLFIYLIITRPHLLLLGNFRMGKKKDYYSVDHAYNAEKYYSQQEIDRILDKISRKGIGSITKAEKQKLDHYSKRVR